MLSHKNLKMQNEAVLVPWGPSIISIVTAVPTSFPVSVITSFSTVVVFPPVRNKSVPWPGVPWLCRSYTDSSSSNQFSVRLLRSFLGVFPAPVDDESIKRSVARQPNFFQCSKLHEDPFKIPLSTFLGQISHMQPVSLLAI